MKLGNSFHCLLQVFNLAMTEPTAATFRELTIGWVFAPGRISYRESLVVRERYGIAKPENPTRKPVRRTGPMYWGDRLSDL